MVNGRQYLQKYIQMLRDNFRSIHFRTRNFGDGFSHYWLGQFSRYQSGSNNPLIKRQLEGASISLSSPLLCASEKVHRRTSKSFWPRTAEPSTARVQQGKREVTMPTPVTLPAQTNMTLKSSVPRFRRIRFEVESENPVDTYIFDDNGLNIFRTNGEKIQSYGGFANLQIHSQSLRLPFSGNWYLVIENRNNVPTAVHYDIWS